MLRHGSVCLPLLRAALCSLALAACAGDGTQLGIA